MRRALLLAWLAGLSTLGLGAGTASGVEFCVNKSPCGGTSKATIQEALTDAAGNTFEDTILVGAKGGTPYEENLFYNHVETVHIVGDGIGQTIIQGPTSNQNAVLILSPTSTISDLTIRAPDVESAAALVWNGTATRIEAVHLGTGATNTVGMRAEGEAVLEDSTVRINGFGLLSVEATTGEGVKIRDSTLTGQLGIDAIGEDLTLSSSLVTAARSPVQTGTGNLTVNNSVLRVTGTVFGDGAIYALSGANVLARHLTMIGSSAGAGVYADASSGNTDVRLYDSIINNFQFALRCFGEGFTTTLQVSYSNWTEETEVNDSGCSETLEPGNDEVTEPDFVSTNPLLLDFRLRAPSPLIDAAGPGDPLIVDLTGAPRVVDGDGVEGARSDMGAYEYQRQPPTAVISAPETATAGQSGSFSAMGSSDPDPGDALAYSWDFGDGGTAEGFAPEHSFAAAGSYMVELTVTDPTGLSDSASAPVQVAAASAPAPDKPGKGPKPKKPKKPKGPNAGPAISELRAVPKRIRRGKGLPKLVKGLKRPGFQFKISKKAGVTLTLVRCKGKRGCKKRARVPGSASFSAFAGANTIKFRGRLTGPKLRRGRYRATLRAAGGNALTTLFRLIR